MKTLDDIMNEWAKDCVIDKTKIVDESANVGKLHHKYYTPYLKFVAKLLHQKSEYKKMLLLKEQYYRGELDIEELNELGWKPIQRKILRQDVQRYIDADKDIIGISLKLGLNQEIVAYLESILKTIGNRSFHITNIVNYTKFEAGSG